MADKKISELTAATLPLAGSEEIAIVQGGETKKVTKSNLGLIPLSGTEVGKNVSGDVVFDTGFFIKTANVNNDAFNEISLISTAIGITNRLSQTNESSFFVNEYEALYTNVDTNSRGLQGSADFSANYSDFTYVQKKYVVDNFSKYLLKVITPTANVTGTNAETVLYTWTIPANTLNSNDWFSIDDFTLASNGAVIGTSLFRVRVSSANTLPNTTNSLLATNIMNSGSVSRLSKLSRRLHLTSGNFIMFQNDFGTSVDSGPSRIDFIPFNNTITNYMFFTVQPADVSNSFYLDTLIINR